MICSIDVSPFATFLTPMAVELQLPDGVPSHRHWLDHGLNSFLRSERKLVCFELQAVTLTQALSANLRARSAPALMEKMMKNLRLWTVGTAPLLTSGVALAQTGTMMGGDHSGSGFGWMGGYGGVWMPVLLIVVVIALVVLVMQRKDK